MGSVEGIMKAVEPFAERSKKFELTLERAVEAQWLIARKMDCQFPEFTSHVLGVLVILKKRADLEEAAARKMAGTGERTARRRKALAKWKEKEKGGGLSARP